jgi:RNA polymerase sigma-32 factor
MATKTRTTTIKKTANAKKSTKLDAKLGDDPNTEFDDIDDDELDEFDEPDFDSLGAIR